MRINLETILTHASERLSAVGPDNVREEQVGAFKRFLKIETERLRIRHRFGLGGGEITRGRSYLVDLVVCRACHLAASEVASSDIVFNDCAIVALGGYGRQDLAPFSDVDILFLHAGRRSKGAKEFVEHVLYLLWDMGLTVGHSFRSVSDCVAMARNDLHSRTALSEARLLTGNTHLLRRLLKELDDAVFKNRQQTNAFFQALRLELRARYDRFGRAVCVQEPNVKESAGGLRDLHTVLWLGHARYGLKGLDDLRARDVLSGIEYGTARRAYDFLARARNEAHFLTGRKTDLLTLDLQPQIAASLGYKPKRGLMASELFMRDYYQRAQELHEICESFFVRATESRNVERRFVSRARQVAASFELRRGNFYLTIKRGPHPEQSQTTKFEIKQGKLYLKDEGIDFHNNPMLLIEIFAVAQNEGVGLSDELKLTVRKNLSIVDRRFRESSDVASAFVSLLRRRGRVGAALRAMHETGLLRRFIPEFARINFLVQHDFYHKYTIDEHTLKAIEALDELATEREGKLARFSKVLAEIEDTAPLYLGLLLHDIGKGRGAGHVHKGARIAQRVSGRLGLKAKASDQVIFLIQHHLLMSHLSERRDLNEEGLIEGFAGAVGSLDWLNSLLLLTYADINGVGPGVWNDWKATLLWELYTRARSRFTGGKSRSWDWSHVAHIKQTVVESLRAEFSPSEVERHLAMMPERYLRATGVEQIAEHFRLARQVDDLGLAADWQVAQDRHCVELTVSTRDSAGLFARIAGTLTASGIDILSADIYTREDGIVIDTFKVREVSKHHTLRPKAWPKVESDLKAAIEGRLDVAAAVETWLKKVTPTVKRGNHSAATKPAVRFDSESSPTSTVIEVRAEDGPGLAYKLASTLAALELDITFAKIATEKSHALDVFYVTDREGEKLGLTKMPAIESALISALSAAETTKLKEAV